MSLIEEMGSDVQVWVFFHCLSDGGVDDADEGDEGERGEEYKTRQKRNAASMYRKQRPDAVVESSTLCGNLGQVFVQCCSRRWKYSTRTRKIGRAHV